MNALTAPQSVREAVDHARLIVKLESQIKECLAGDREYVYIAYNHDSLPSYEKRDAIKFAPTECAGQNSEALAGVIQALQLVEITLDECGDRAGEAEVAKRNALAQLQEMHTAAVTHEVEQAELAAMRAELQRQREEQEKRDAESKAKAKAEEDARQAEIQRQRAELKAQQDEIDRQRRKIQMEDSDLRRRIRSIS